MGRIKRHKVEFKKQDIERWYTVCTEVRIVYPSQKNS